MRSLCHEILRVSPLASRAVSPRWLVRSSEGPGAPRAAQRGAVGVGASAVGLERGRRMTSVDVVVVLDVDVVVDLDVNVNVDLDGTTERIKTSLTLSGSR